MTTGQVDFSVAGKVALVTGAASGIGRAISIRLAQAGSSLILIDIVDASDLAAELNATFIQCDVAREDQYAVAVKQAVALHGHIDILVNNAGISVSNASILDDSDAAYLRAFRVNTLGVVHGIRCVAPVMPKGSSIITISSLSSLLGAPLLGAYAASKAALAAVTRTSALELAPRGIRVNEVAPGAVRTAMNDSGAPFVERELAWVKAAGAFGRMAEPEEIAAVVHFLASDDCQMITGQTLVVDGGLTAGPSLGLLDALVEGDNK